MEIDVDVDTFPDLDDRDLEEGGKEGGSGLEIDMLVSLSIVW